MNRYFPLTTTQLTWESVFRQRVQPTGGNPCFPVSVRSHRGEASQCVLRLGGALVPVPLGQRRVRLQRGHFTHRRAEEGRRKLGRWGWKVGRVGRPESNRSVGKVGGYSTLYWTLERKKERNKWKQLKSTYQSTTEVIMKIKKKKKVVH